MAKRTYTHVYVEKLRAVHAGEVAALREEYRTALAERAGMLVELEVLSPLRNAEYANFKGRLSLLKAAQLAYDALRDTLVGAFVDGLYPYVQERLGYYIVCMLERDVPMSGKFFLSDNVTVIRDVDNRRARTHVVGTNCLATGDRSSLPRWSEVHMAPSDLEKFIADMKRLGEDLRAMENSLTRTPRPRKR